VVDAAQFHGVEGWLRDRVGAGNRELDVAAFSALARHQRALSELSVAQEALSRAGVEYLVIKGPALAEPLHGSPALRSYVDLDLLVRPSSLSEAWAALLRAGFVPLDVNWPLLRSLRVTELRLRGSSGGVLDLHWSLTHGSSGMTSPRVSTLLQRARRVDFGGGVGGPTLSVGDTLVHVAVHAAASGGHRLIWLKDVIAALDLALATLGARALADVVDDW
jgi:hypothetical protein